MVVLEGQDSGIDARLQVRLINLLAALGASTEVHDVVDYKALLLCVASKEPHPCLKTLSKIPSDQWEHDLGHRHTGPHPVSRARE